MTQEQKIALLILGGVGVYLLTRPKKTARYEQVKGTMTAVQLAEAYRELVSSPIRVFINPVNEAEPDTGTPWAVDLAGYTRNYVQVMTEYNRYYGTSLTDDLIKWFSPAELSQYVAALWQAHQQVMQR